MKNKLSYAILLMLLSVFVHSQNKWDQDLEIRYQVTDEKERTLNYVEVKKDTLLYEWMDKEKTVKRKYAMDEELGNKLLKAIAENKVLKFKRRNLVKGQKNITLTYMKTGKTKVVVFPSPVKIDSKEEKFIKEFMEPILLKVFAQEIKNHPR